MRKCITVILSVILIMLSGCTTVDYLTTLEYNTTSIDDIEKSDGQVISVVGYMSMLSPTDSTMVYLMNVPFNTEPGRYPIEDKLTDYIACYPPVGSKIEFTEECIKLTGTVTYKAVEKDTMNVSYPFYLSDCTYEVFDGNIAAIVEYNYGVTTGTLSILDQWLTAVYTGMSNPETAEKINATSYINKYEVSIGSIDCPNIESMRTAVQELSDVYNKWLDTEHKEVSQELVDAYVKTGNALKNWIDNIGVRGNE